MPGGDFRVLGIQRLTGTGDGRGRRCGERESERECNALAVKSRLALAARLKPVAKVAKPWELHREFLEDFSCGLVT